jgi:hypothetical protein
MVASLLWERRMHACHLNTPTLYVLYLENLRSSNRSTDPLAKRVQDRDVAVSRRHRTIHLVKRVPDSEICTHLIELP